MNKPKMQFLKSSNPIPFKSVVAGKFVRSLISDNFSREPYHLPLSDISSYPFHSVPKTTEMKNVKSEFDKQASSEGFLNMIFSGNVSKA